MKIASIGDISIDHYVNLNLKKPGGIAFNFAVNSMDKTVKASLLSAVGSDTGGKKLKQLLKKINIETTHMAYIQGKTAKQKIVLENGEREFVGYKPGVLKYWKLAVKDLKFLNEQDAIFVPLSDGMKHIFESVAFLKTDAIKIADFSQDSEYADFAKENNSIVKFCPYFQIIFVGATEQEYMLLASMSKKYPEKLFILTLGTKGCICFSNGKEFFQAAAYISNIVDTTGAGDAFQASFVSSYLKSNDIAFSLKKGTIYASKVIQQVGSTKYVLWKRALKRSKN